MLTSLIQITVLFLNLYLGIFVLSQNNKSVENIAFSVMAFIAVFWAFANYMLDISPLLIWQQFSYALGSLVIASGLIWTLITTEDNPSKRKITIIGFFAILFFSGSFLPDFIIKSYNPSYAGTATIGLPGWGMLPYLIYFLITGGLIVIKLYNAQRNASDPVRSRQLRNIFFGSLVTLITVALSSFVLPSLFSIFPFGGTDNASFLIFLVFIGYSITKYHLFNIRIIAIELVILCLWLTILLRTLIATSLAEIIFNCALFIITVVFGILLIQLTRNEIRSREKIKMLAQNIIELYTRSDNFGL